MKKILFVLLTILLITGCSYKELNELAIANAIGIDYIDNKYYVTAQIMDLKKESDITSKQQTLLYEGEGKTIVSAIRDISLKYPNTLYLGHLELLVVGKGLIDKGINNTFDYFLRSPEARNDCMLLVSTEKDAKEIINPKENKEAEFPSKDLISTVENSVKRNGLVVNTNIEEFVSSYLKEGIDPIATNISINQEDEEVKTILTGIAVFKDNKYISNLSKNEAIAYNIINNDFFEIAIDIPFKDSISSAIIMPESSFDVSVNKDVIVNINITVQIHMIESHSKTDFNIEESKKEIAESSSKVIKGYIKELLNYSKDNDVDILGIKNYIYSHYYKDYKNYKDKNIYKSAKFNTNIKTEVFRFGNVDKNTLGGD